MRIKIPQQVSTILTVFTKKPKPRRLEEQKPKPQIQIEHILLGMGVVSLMALLSVFIAKTGSMESTNYYYHFNKCLFLMIK